MRKIIKFYSIIFLLSVSLVYANDTGNDSADKVSIAGYITDASTGEALIGATVYIKEIEGGATTNMYGFLALFITSAASSISAVLTAG